MSLDTNLENLQRTVPECVAAGAIDIGTGMLLSIRTSDDHPPEATDMLVAATGELFQGQNATGVEDMFKRIRGVEDDDLYHTQEIVLFSQNLLHVFQRCKRNPDVVVTTVCRRRANLGKVMVKSRSMLDDIAQSI